LEKFRVDVLDALIIVVEEKIIFSFRKSLEARSSRIRKANSNVSLQTI
jgi:hypothetical protein